MNSFLRSHLNHASLFLAAFFSLVTIAGAQPVIIWEAFNDHRPTDGVTSPNASIWDLHADGIGGVLKNIQTGADLEASVLVAVEGAAPDDFGANSYFFTNSPAYLLFNGKVDTGNLGLPGIRSSAETKLILNFTGLDPTKRYNFRGSVSRGGLYSDRWSVYSISGADSYVAAHVDGSDNRNLFTKITYPNGTLETNQVALNTGENRAGSLVGWDNIEPGTDGTFAIEAQQYTGPAPFGNPAAGPYGYGLNAIYLAQIESTGNLRITENPANQTLPAGRTATLRVAATSPQAIQFQWQQAAPGSSTFADIPGATQASFTTAPLTVADHGAKFRARVTSGATTTLSAEATVNVDGSLPTITSVHGSINFNAVHLAFSEPMKLELLANPTNYALGVGLTISSATALNSTNARLVTLRQRTNTTYTVTVNNLEDIAGNKIAANTAVTFPSFSVQPGTVGLEIWHNIPGGAVQNLRDEPRFPNSPDIDFAITSLDSLLVFPSGPNNTYGGRFRAWLTPEESGQYEFFLRADDSADLYIGADDTFEPFDSPDRLPDASDTTAGDAFQEPGIDLSTTPPIQLERGRRYAILALWKEGNIEDYCQVAWRKVGDVTPADQLQPIASRFLSYYGPGPLAPAGTITIARAAGTVRIDWTGTTLQSSDDLTTWRDEPGAAKPFIVTPVNKRFYRFQR